MGILQQGLKALFAASLPKHLFMVRGERSSNSDENDLDQPTIALTFDDGPHPLHTPRLLDYLAASSIAATFFVVGERARKHPDIIKRIVRDGHAIGNHTLTHSEPKTTSAKCFLAEIDETRKLLQDLTGTDCLFVRPPKGKLTASKCLGVWKRHLSIILWSQDPRDYAMHSRREMEQWYQSYEPIDGDIILMHDNHPYASASIEMLPSHSDFENLQFVKVTHWLPRLVVETNQNSTTEAQDVISTF